MSRSDFDVLGNLDLEILKVSYASKVDGILRTCTDHTLLSKTAEIPTAETPIEAAATDTTVRSKSGIVSGIIFLIKYLATTASIFGVLMVGSNYQAYYQIVKSTLFSEQIVAREQALIQSVQAASQGEEIELSAAPETERKHKYEAGENSPKAPSYSIRALQEEAKAKTVKPKVEITPYENRIVIPKIGKNIPLVEVTQQLVGDEQQLNDIFMEELENGVVRYPSSVKPGEDGNTFIFGHSSNFPWIKGDYNDVFALLDHVEYGDEIIIYYEQKKYVYRIETKKVIDPNNVGVIKKHDLKPKLTLMTCWPIGTTLDRLIVSGELIEETDL